MHLTPAVKDRIEISIGKALSRIVRFLLIRFPCSVGQLAQPEHLLECLWLTIEEALVRVQ
jgi:hypothetical protein